MEKNPKLSGLIFFGAFIAWIGATPCSAAPVVSNLSAGQRTGTQLVDIAYDLAAPGFEAVAVSLQISSDAGATWTVPVTSASGAIGGSVAPGTGKAIVWDAGADWAGNYSTQMRFRVVADDGFAEISGGSFTMGRTSGDTESDAPPVTVTVSSFYMAKTETTKAQWDDVRTWGLSNGYTDLAAGGGKASNHPVHSVSWWNVVKWCNARSEKEGLTPVYTVSGAVMRTGTTEPVANWTANGYRLPTEAEWEKAARGGVSGQRFPWGTDTISHADANFRNAGGESYATGATDYHPSFATGSHPFTSPARSFAANGYGLFDMAGNVYELCWDWYGWGYYTTSNGTTDPRGPNSGTLRVLRGGSWLNYASGVRCGARQNAPPGGSNGNLVGFRPARTHLVEDMSLILAGSFTMGRTSGDTDNDAPPVTVTVSPFYLAETETTKAQWDTVRTWGLSNGYSDLAAGGGKAANHPVQTVSWWDVVKWCNARSEMEGLTPVYTVGGAVMRTGATAPDVNWSANGYRLPTEAEWEKAARGGVSGQRFPWGTDTISHTEANYFGNYSIGIFGNQSTGYHPTYSAGTLPYTCPVGSFAANGYGLYDMSGNVWEWCWDWYGASSYASEAIDPRGPSSGTYRVWRGGSWYVGVERARSSGRSGLNSPDFRNTDSGFRPARSLVPNSATGGAETGNETVDTRDAPTVSSPTATSLTAIGAMLGGHVGTDGGAAITERGVVYAATATNNDPVIDGTGVIKVTANGTTGVFTIAVTGLTQGTGYSYKAYVISSEGTSYTTLATFTTLSTNADLDALSLGSNTLSPAFAAGVTSYTVAVVSATNSITVTPTRAQANAIIEARVNGGAYALVTSGSPSGSLGLIVGSNTVEVRVTAQAGNTKTYTITVTYSVPIAVTITRLDSVQNSLPSVRYRVLFGHPVKGLKASHFSLNGSAAGGASIIGVTGASNEWIVTVATSGEGGGLQLNLVGYDGVVFASDDQPLNGPTVSGPTYSTEKVAETIPPWQWIRRVAGSTRDADDTVTALSVDPDGGVWLGGMEALASKVGGTVSSWSPSRGTYGHHYLRKFDSLGKQLLVQRWGPGDGTNAVIPSGDGGAVIAADRVTEKRQVFDSERGEFVDVTERPGMVSARDRSGRERWRVLLGTLTRGGNRGYADVYGVAVAGGYAYASGYYDLRSGTTAWFGNASLSGIADQYNPFLAKIDIANGNVLWARGMTAGFASFGPAYALRNGNILCSGERSNTETNSTFKVFCYNPQGAVVWSREWSVTSADENVESPSFAETSDGALWVSIPKSGLQRLNPASGALVGGMITKAGLKMSIDIAAHPREGLVWLIAGAWNGRKGYRCVRLGPAGTTLWEQTIWADWDGTYRGEQSKVVVANSGAIYLGVTASGNQPGTWSQYEDDEGVLHVVYTRGPVNPPTEFSGLDGNFPVGGRGWEGFVSCLAAPVAYQTEVARRVDFPMSDLDLGGPVVRAVGLPAGLRFNPTSQRLEGFASKSGTFNVRVMVDNGDGTVRWDRFTMTVAAMPANLTGRADLVLERSAAVGNELGGAVSVTVSATGQASGVLTLPTGALRFRAPFEILSATEGFLAVDFPASRFLPEPLRLEVAIRADGKAVGRVSSPHGEGVLRGWRNSWDARRAPLLDSRMGRFNLLYDLSAASPAGLADVVPQGTGWAMVTTNRGGIASHLAMLADGIKVTSSCVLGPQGEFSMWWPLYRHQGSLLQQGVIDVNGAVSATASWVRLESNDVRQRTFRAGFGVGAQGPVDLQIAGARWVAPASGTVVMGLPYSYVSPAANAWMTWAFGGLQGRTTDVEPLPLMIDNRGRAPIPPGGINPNSVSVSVRPSNGLLSAKMTIRDEDPLRPGSGIMIPRTVKFTLLLVPGLPAGRLGGGYFLLPQLADPTAQPPTTSRTTPIFSGKVSVMRNSPLP